MDILDFKSASRCYFMDMGLANYYLTRTGTDSRVLAGTLNENYVYINLKKRQDFHRKFPLKPQLLLLTEAEKLILWHKAYLLPPDI